MVEKRGIYEGDFEYGCKKGRGKMTYYDGTIYDGMWLMNRKHGQGVLHLPTDSSITKYASLLSKFLILSDTAENGTKIWDTEKAIYTLPTVRLSRAISAKIMYASRV